MWLINFHIAFSTLLLAAEIGIYCMFRKNIKRKVGGIDVYKRQSWILIFSLMAGEMVQARRILINFILMNA